MHGCVPALNSLALEYQREGKYAEAIKTFEESKRRCNDGNLVRRATGTYTWKDATIIAFLIVHV